MPARLLLEVLITIFTIVSYMPLNYDEVGWARLVGVCSQSRSSALLSSVAVLLDSR